MQPRLYWQLHTVAFLLEKQADESLKEQFSIGFAQYKVLRAIGENMHAKQNTIADMLDQTEASVSRQIKILQKRKLITVDMVMGNKRARELSLTEQGEETLRLSQEVLDMTQAKVFGGLNYEEQQYFTVLFERMIKNVRS
jgi:DNA-binding MarR family transcriptional regulator